ncbi:hypothetical protein QA811_01925 [Streptomyces sp. B21-102]|uniref:hypothetical protein n=1 Tax=Streptomyces sp. B21-102 TaxID=3039416 RepID=UPI002FF3DB10
MSILHWWFVEVPSWGWRNIAHRGHAFAGFVIFCGYALAYAALNLAVAGGVLAGVAAVAKAFLAGFRRETGEQPPVSGE